MWLDARFSPDYYLRVIELAIRDRSRMLVYDEERKTLEALSVRSQTVQEIDLQMMQNIVREVFSRQHSYYSISARFLSIIDTRLREETPRMDWFRRWFFTDSFKNNQLIVKRLSDLKAIIMQERQLPATKVAHIAESTLKRKNTNFSSWEDFSHQIRVNPPTSDTTLLDTMRQRVDSDKVMYDLMDAMTTFLKSQGSYQPLSLELLDQFLLESTSPYDILSDEVYDFLMNLKQLFSWSHEDFQAIVSGILTHSLEEVLMNALGESQIFSPQGKALIYKWRESTHIQPIITGFLSETVHGVVKNHLQEVLHHHREALPEYVATVYSIRDHQPALWLKMMRSLLIYWLLDFDDKVHHALEKQLLVNAPHPTFWQQCLAYLTELFSKSKFKS